MHRIGKGVLAGMLAVSGVAGVITMAPRSVEAASEYKILGAVTDVEKEGNIVYVTYAGGEKTKITFLENDIFRFNMDPNGDFAEYPTPNSKDHTATIVQQSDDSDEYSKPVPNVNETEDSVTITTDKISLEIAKKTSMMKLTNLENGNVVWEENAPLQYKDGSTVQTLKQSAAENFYGGGTQNGRFVHTGNTIEIVNTNNWVDGGVASPNPFYWSTAGYGVLRDTWKPGEYDFGDSKAGVVKTEHNEKRFDAYYFVDATPAEILNDYYQVTGKPVLLPENSFYLGHLNCYNRDAWIETSSGGNLLEDGKYYKETNRNGAVNEGETLETLNGTNDYDYKFSARAVIDGYVNNDMPLGWFLPNDGYGCGYGQSDTNIDDNIENLQAFTEYAHKYGVGTGLWTQSNLTPDPTQPIHLQRDFEKEVNVGGIRTLKTDVAWVGNGYSFGLNGIKKAYDIITATGDRPNIVTLDGWAGTQRYGGIWTGDQSGGNWEYIRFHIPTYIGQSLSGNPNIGSDMDGIFGGSSLITTRDYQWKIFTQYMLNMDGWGSYPKKPYIFGEDTTSINRMYLKLKAQLMPYLYTEAYNATQGLPMLRAMFLNYPEDANAYGKNVQYQFMYGEDFLVAPVYQDTNMDEHGNDIRNGIYLPDENEIWIDYFSGKQYRGGQTLNNFDAPIWKLPLFVKNGAIIPMYEENNNAMPKSDTNTMGLDKTKRIIEFYPEGNSSYQLYEDDGVSVDNSNKEEVNYKDSVSTVFTSVVKDQTATLTAEKSTGTYEGYDSMRETTFVVNVSKQPESVTGTIGGEKVDFEAVSSQEEFDQAAGNVYFYNEKPNLNKYATDGSAFSEVEIITTPKLYVKTAETDVNKNAVQVVIEGFENKQDLNANVENETLGVPQNVRTVEEEVAPTQIPLYWDEVEGATEYQVEADGIIQSGMTDPYFLHTDLEYHSTHTYRVRAVNADGYSKWSEPFEATSALDPYRNTIPNLTISTSDSASGYSADRLIDREYTQYWFTDWTNPAINNRDKVFNFDFKQIYKMDKVQLYPHSDYLSNQPSEVSVYGSTNGTDYTLVADHVAFASKDANPKDVMLNGAKMRYMRLVVHKPAGNYIALTEIMPLKVDGTGPIVYGDVTSDGVVDSNDLTMMQNYVGLTPADADWEYVVDKGCDFNEDSVIDAYDVAVVANIVNKPSAEKDTAGQIAIIADKTEIKANETVELNIMGVGMENVSAFSVRIPYDVSKFDFVSVTNAPATSNMTTFSKPRAHSDGTSDIFAVYANVDSKTLVNGTAMLGKITLRAKEDITWNAEIANAKLVGNNNSVVDDALIQESSEEPQVPAGYRPIEITADQIESQEGNTLQPNMGVDKLVDGKVDDDAYRFEFQWGNSAEEIDASLPHELTYHFNDATAVSKLRVQIRHNGDTLNAGALKDFELYGLDAEGNRTKLGSYTMTAYDQSFEFNKEAKAYAGIVLKALTSQGGQAYKLNIDETTFYQNETVAVTDIDFADSVTDKIVQGRFAQIDAVIAPENATNGFYTVTSSDESVAKVIRIKTGENKFVYALYGVKTGSAEITVTSLADADVKKTMTITVVENSKDSLAELIAQADKYTENLFTADSFKNFKQALENAKAVYADEKADQDMIDSAEASLRAAMNDLKIESGNEIKEGVTAVSATSEITTAEGESGEKENLLDKDSNTYWHTNYLKPEECKMPQSVTFDLGHIYTLNNVSFLPRQGARNGDIIRAAVELSLDGETFVRVGEYTFDNDGKELNDKESYKNMAFAPEKARYVRFVALSTLGDSNDTYASAAEVSFYGVAETDKSALLDALDEALAFKAEDFTKDSWALYQNEVKAAQAVADDKTASQDKVDEAVNALIQAKDLLVKRGDTSGLAALVGRVENLDAKDYTADSWKAVEAALKDAKDVLAEADNVSVVDVKEAEEALKNAVNDLVYANGEKPGTDDGDKPGHDAGGKPGTGSKPGQGDSAGTAAADNAGGYVAAIALAGIAAEGLRRKRKLNK